MPDTRIDSGRAGFALVEVLASLALAALVALLLVETVRVAGRTASDTAAAGSADHVQAVRDHLRRTLGSLASRRLDGTRPVLRGGPDSLQAALAPDRALERPVELAVSLAAVPRPDGLADIVEARAPLEAGPDRTAQSEILPAGVSGLAIRYLGPPAERMPASWLTAILQVRTSTVMARTRSDRLQLQGLADGAARLIAYELAVARTYRVAGLGFPEDGSVVACR